MTIAERKLACGAARGLAMAAAGFASLATAQQPGYVGRPVYFDGPDRTTRVAGQSVPPGAVGYTPLPGGGLRWEYGSGGSRSFGPSHGASFGPSYGPSFGSSYGPSFGSSYGPGYGAPVTLVSPPTHYVVNPYTGEILGSFGGGHVVTGGAPSTVTRAPERTAEGTANYFNGREYASVNGLKPPKGAIGWRFDGRTGATTWILKNESDSATAGPATRPAVPARPAEPSATEVAERDLRTRRTELVTFSTNRERASELPDREVRARRGEVLVKLASEYTKVPEPPASLDSDENANVDKWVATVNATKYARLRALYHLAEAATVDELKAKQALWMGRCTLPDAPDREDGAMLALYPDGSSAKAALNLNPYDPTKRTFAAATFAELEKHDVTAAGQIAAKLLELSQGFTRIDVTTVANGKEAETAFIDTPSKSAIGHAFRLAFRKLPLGDTPNLIAQIRIEDDEKKARPVSYCFFTKRWSFR